jgi:hypothetical protein
MLPTNSATSADPSGSAFSIAADPALQTSSIRPRRRLRAQVRIRIAPLADIQCVGKVLQELLDQLRRCRRAKADRVCHALGQRDAVVRDIGWQVKHVAGLQLAVVRGAKIAQDLERNIRQQLEVALRARPPAAPAGPLQQEYIVRVEVRADAAAGNRIADHQVIEARVRDEVESLQQRGRRVYMQCRRPARAASSRLPASARKSAGRKGSAL